MNEKIKVFVNKMIYGGGVFFDLTKWLIFILVLFLMVNTFFFAIFVVSGESMEPNLHDTEWVFWNKGIYNKENPQRGDIVVVNYPGDPNHKKYVKRIIGLPGDKVAIEDEKVFINNEELSETYLQFFIPTDPDGIWNIGSDQYFVMGDNRPGSNDSRFFGPVERRFVLGKAISIIFPRFRLTKDI